MLDSPEPSTKASPSVRGKRLSGSKKSSSRKISLTSKEKEKKQEKQEKQEFPEKLGLNGGERQQGQNKPETPEKEELASNLNQEKSGKEFFDFGTEATGQNLAKMIQEEFEDQELSLSRARNPRLEPESPKEINMVLFFPFFFFLILFFGFRFLPTKTCELTFPQIE